MITLKLNNYKREEVVKLLDLFTDVKCECFPQNSVMSFYEDGVRYCYKCEHRHFCKDILTTADFLFDSLYQKVNTKLTR